MIRFTKMHGCGNDYIYIDTSKETVPPDKRAELSVRLSDRHKGVGSDGIIYINPTDKADFEMEMYNADGSRSAMCGNGIRCVAKYVYDHKLTRKDTLDILTLAGVKRIELTILDDKAVSAKVDMGIPVLDMGRIPAAIPSHGAEDRIIGQKAEIMGKEYEVTLVSMGNPHCIVFLKERVWDLDLEKIGPGFENSPLFPERINTEFVNVIDRAHMDMRVWERGSGETMACGTGASAVCVAAVLGGFCDREVDIKLLGGNLKIQWVPEGSVFMTGPAEEVYEGVVNISY